MMRFACVLLLAGIVSAVPALALPGDSIGTVLSRIKHKPFKVTSNISEMGGNRVYQAVAPYRGNRLGFYFQNSDGVSDEESIAYSGDVHFGARRDPRVREAVSLVYDARIASDYLAATPVGRAGIFHTKVIMTFYRGARFGYSAYGSNLRVLRLSKLVQALAEAKRCAMQECGD